MLFFHLSYFTLSALFFFFFNDKEKGKTPAL